MTMTALPPWNSGPFELLVHAEGHLITGEDFDRRIALISFDNAVEVAITTYLTLNPIQRGGRSYPRADVDQWQTNYHTKLDFLDHELSTRAIAWQVERSYVVWAHDQRNEHHARIRTSTRFSGVPPWPPEAALWVFSTLYGVDDIERRLVQALLQSATSSQHAHDDAFDRAIDHQYGMIDLGEQSYYASELLYSVDYDAYREAGERLCSSEPELDQVTEAK
jgi:hypothetical protein